MLTLGIIPEPREVTRSIGYSRESMPGSPNQIGAWGRWRGQKQVLGAIPTDAELATMYQYTPVNSGWVVTKDGRTIPYLGGASGTAVPPTTVVDAGAQIVGALHDANRRAWILGLVSTGAIVLGVAISTLKVLKTKKLYVKESHHHHHK